MALHPFRDFMSNISNKLALRTRNNKMGNYSIDVNQKVTLNPNSSKTVYDERMAAYIFLLTFSSNSEMGQLIIKTKKSEGYESVSIGELFPAGKESIESMGYSIKNILDHPSYMWGVNKADNDSYKLTLQRPLIFPRGIEVVLSNNSDDPIEIGVRFHGVNYDY